MPQRRRSGLEFRWLPTAALWFLLSLLGPVGCGCPQKCDYCDDYGNCVHDHLSAQTDPSEDPGTGEPEGGPGCSAVLDRATRAEHLVPVAVLLVGLLGAGMRREQ